MQSVGRGSGATVSLCQSRPFVSFRHLGKVAAHDWGAATPLARAAFAYPRSGSMYPTIFRFVPAAVGAEASIPAAAASASELRFSERGRVTSGSGWYACTLCTAGSRCDTYR